MPDTQRQYARSHARILLRCIGLCERNKETASGRRYLNNPVHTERQRRMCGDTVDLTTRRLEDATSALCYLFHHEIFKVASSRRTSGECQLPRTSSASLRMYGVIEITSSRHSLRSFVHFLIPNWGDLGFCKEQPANRYPSH